jgi:hypothetical protein
VIKKLPLLPKTRGWLAHYFEIIERKVAQKIQRPQTLPRSVESIGATGGEDSRVAGKKPEARNSVSPELLKSSRRARGREARFPTFFLETSS